MWACSESGLCNQCDSEPVFRYSVSHGGGRRGADGHRDFGILRVSNCMDLHGFRIFSYDSVTLSAVFLLLDDHVGGGDSLLCTHLAENGA